MRRGLGAAGLVALVVGLMSACGGSARVSSKRPAPHQREVYVRVWMDCYRGTMLGLADVSRVFAEHGVPLRQDAPPHDQLDWLALRHPLPKNDYAWLWLNTVPNEPCGTQSGVTAVKNLQIAYHTPVRLTIRIRAALRALLGP